ncbi:MAG: glycerophosphodiester phosphodiesterase family protein [Hyphomonadaceae bacterium]
MRALFAAVLALAACGDRAPASIGAPPVATLAPSDLPGFFDCLRENDATAVSAHRGGPRPGFAENSIETFRMTISRAPSMLEIDISRTRDGVLVLMHDDTVDRTTNGSGAVSSMTVADFQALRLRDDGGEVLDEGPPTLRQALVWAAGQAILELDVKRGVSYEDVAREVRDAGAMGRAIFITYSIDGASRLARVAPDAMIYTTITSARDLETLERRGVDLSHIVAWLGDDGLDRDLAQALNARGVEVRWGLFGRDADFASAAEAGVEGVAVNDPEAAYRAIDAADSHDGYAALQCAPQPGPHTRWLNEG